ncbi:hypothetical protein ACWDA9_39490, partial [Streptomyces sp. NPDC001193]
AAAAVLSGAHPTRHRSVLRCGADPVLRRPLAIAVGAALMNPIVGIGAVVYYSTLVFPSAGVPGGTGARSASLTAGSSRRRSPDRAAGPGPGVGRDRGPRAPGRCVVPGRVHSLGACDHTKPTMLKETP